MNSTERCQSLSKQRYEEENELESLIIPNERDFQFFSKQRLNGKCAYTPKQAKDLARAAAWAYFLLPLNKQDAVRLGYNSKSAVLKEAMVKILKENLYRPRINNYRTEKAVLNVD